MIELLTGAGARVSTPALIDFGGVIRPATGAKIQRLDRLGNRFKIAVTLPLGKIADKAALIADLLAAKTQGLRINFPLQGVNQGSPGFCQVNGSGQSGTTLAIKNLTPGYVIAKGYWLSIVNSAGQHYLHNVLVGGTASGGGTASITITPMLRYPFANGNSIHFTAPKIEGLVDGDEWAWQQALGGIVDGLAFTIEEAE